MAKRPPPFRIGDPATCEHSEGFRFKASASGSRGQWCALCGALGLRGASESATRWYRDGTRVATFRSPSGVVFSWSPWSRKFGVGRSLETTIWIRPGPRAEEQVVDLVRSVR